MEADVIDLYTGEDLISRPKLADEIYRFRYGIAVDEMGWDIPGLTNARDIDAFDLPSTIHIVDRGRRGRIVGVSRLNPMSGPTLTRDVFPDYCAPGRMPTTAASMEHSRFLAQREGHSTTQYMRILGRLLLAVHEYAQLNNVETITSLTYMTHYSLAVRLFGARPLGMPKVYEPDGNTYLAFICRVSDSGLENTRRYVGIRKPQLPDLRNEVERDREARRVVPA